MSSFAMLAAVLVAHYAYYLWPQAGVDRPWAQYVGGGVGFALASMALFPAVRARPGVVGALGSMACVWGAIEGAQQAVCGAISWGTPQNDDLCVALFGEWPYQVAAALLASFLVSRSLFKRR